jgi:hypothetical protein
VCGLRYRKERGRNSVEERERARAVNCQDSYLASSCYKFWEQLRSLHVTQSPPPAARPLLLGSLLFLAFQYDPLISFISSLSFPLLECTAYYFGAIKSRITWLILHLVAYIFATPRYNISPCRNYLNINSFVLQEKLLTFILGFYKQIYFLNTVNLSIF